MTANVAHSDDADALRLLDGACEPAERASLEAHATACPACASRRALLERRVAMLTVRLAAADEAPRSVAFPASRVERAGRLRIVRRWGLAAAVTLLLAGAAGVAPVRAWIVETARALWAFASGRSAAGPAALPAARAPANDTAGAVTFSSPPGTFVLRFTGRQVSGTVTVEAGERADASAAITGRRDSVELLVLPDGLRIVNPRSATAGYIVKVPGGLSRVVLQIGPEAPIVLEPVAHSGRWVVDLAARK